MSLDQIIAFVLFFLLFLLPLIGDFFKKKKKNPLPKSREDFERRYEVKLEEQKRSHQHLKPPPAQPPKLESSKMETNTNIGKNPLSHSYKPGYNLESEIKEREFTTKVKSRHIESEIETLGFSSLLQERFSSDIQAVEKKSSLAKTLLKKGHLKNAIILSEILKRRF